MTISLKERLGEERYYEEALRFNKEWFKDAQKIASPPNEVMGTTRECGDGKQTPQELAAAISGMFDRAENFFIGRQFCQEHRKDPSKNWDRIHGILNGSCQKTHDALQERFDRELKLRKDPSYVPLSEFWFNPLYDQEIKRRERQFLEKEAIMNSPIRRTWHFHKKAMIRITTVAIVVLSYAKYNNIYRDFAVLQRVFIEMMAR